MTDGTKRYLETIEWLGKLYDYANDQFFNGELCRPVITVQMDDKNRAYGWYTMGKVWHEEKPSKDGLINVSNGEHEINMSAQYLNRSAYSALLFAIR